MSAISASFRGLSQQSHLLRGWSFTAGIVGFGCAIGVHYIIGYTDFTHLAPAWLGSALFIIGIFIHRREIANRAGTNKSLDAKT